MKEISKEQLDAVIRSFDYTGTIVQTEFNRDGHINNTIRIDTDRSRYILQRINTDVFQKPEELMENIRIVTDHLKRKVQNSKTLTIVPTKDGRDFLRDGSGDYWRSYLFVSDSRCYDSVSSNSLFTKCGNAFGNFLNLLSDCPAERLHETIPDFHNTAKRFDGFMETVRGNVLFRNENAGEEIDFLLKRKKYADIYRRIVSEKEIPVRIVHNDTKLTNILFDRNTDLPLCVIDLDTVMPGLYLYDFGDAIRYGANSSKEDEPDLDKVHFLPERYEAYKKGFLEGCSCMTENEKALLPYGAMMITFEQAVRFLDDYLLGDIYYQIDRPLQNLERARVQIRLLSEMESYFQPDMEKKGIQE